jgi:hypothetical protein
MNDANAVCQAVRALNEVDLELVYQRMSKTFKLKRQRLKEVALNVTLMLFA